MGKKSRDRARAAKPSSEQQEGAVGPRQPCPCGSGKRYKACHGATGSTPYVARPFEGMPSEPDVIALRELVPAATAPLPLRDSDRTVLLATLLPGAVPAMVRPSGDIWLGLQVRHDFGDPARDLGAVLERALEAEPGETVGLTSDPGPGTRIQDLVAHRRPRRDGARRLRVLGRGPGGADPRGRGGARAGERRRQPDREARLRARRLLDQRHDEGAPALGAAGARARAARRAGAAARHSVRTCWSRAPGWSGTSARTVWSVPVWDLPVGTGPEAVEDPAAEFGEALDAALADPRPLTPEERSARAGITGRQVTIR